LVFLLGNRKARLLMFWLVGILFDDPYKSGIAFDTAVVYRVVIPIHGVTALTTKVRHG